MGIREDAGRDLLDRNDLIDAYTRLLDNDRGPRVISVEAGYGEGVGQDPEHVQGGASRISSL